MRRVWQVLVTALIALTIGWGSRAAYDPPGGDTGLLRLSWRVRGEKAETCRPRTQEELAALPVHMRTPEICDRHRAAYRLIVRVDDAVADTVSILPGGAQGDRPIYVLREAPLAPGTHRVRVHFARADSVASELALDTTVTAAAGDIELITLAGDARRLWYRSRRAP